MTEKFNDVVCMDIQREVDNQIQAQQVDTESRSTANEHTSTTTVDAYEEDASSEAEVQQLLYDYLRFEDDIQEAMKEDKEQQDNSTHDCDSGTDTEILIY